MCPVPQLRLQRLQKKEKEWTRYKLPLSMLFLSENNISSFGKVKKQRFYILGVKIIKACPGRKKNKGENTPIKKKIKFSSYIRKFSMYQQLQLHIWPPHIWINICAFPQILGSPSSYTTLQLFHSELPYI
jgi:hypothetical protein